jgi:predicted PurR-regulated permease PerM
MGWDDLNRVSGKAEQDVIGETESGAALRVTPARELGAGSGFDVDGDHCQTAERESMPAQTKAGEPTEAFRRRILVGALIVIALIVLLYFLWQAVYVLLLIFAGVLLAVLLRSMARGVSRLTRLPVGWSLAIVVVVLLGLFALAGWLTAAPILRQFEQLVQKLPESVESLKARLRQHALGNVIVGAAPTTQEIEAGAAGGAAPARVRGMLTNVFNVAVAIIVIAFVGVYLAAEPEMYTNGILRLVPHAYRPKGAEILAALGYTLQWWLIGQGITMIIIGVLTAAGLWAIGIPLWFVIGLLAALFNFIPNFGPLISMVPAVLLALAISPTKAIWVVMLYIVAQNLEGNVITPLIQRRAVLLPPALTIVSQVLLGVTVGALGVLVAAPLMAAVMVLVKMLYVEQTLGDEVETPDDHMKRSEVPPVPE